MTRIISILLLLLYSTATTELHQIFKIDVLVSHYLEHKAGNENLGIGEFLAMHYAASQDHDSRDKELPFKSICDSACASMVYMPTMMFSIIIQTATFSPVQYGDFLPDESGIIFQSAIWQPPRTA